MSLVAFHRFLIVTAILFCFGYGGYETLVFQRGGGVGALALGAVFVLLGVLLGFYLRRLNRFLGYGEEDRAA